MKKIFALLLVLAMVTTGLSVYATDIGPSDLGDDGKVTSNVTVTYNASTANEGAETQETWLVTIPATAEADGQTQDVTVSGSYTPARTLKVTAPETVVLYLDGDTSKDRAILSVDFEDIALAGSYDEISVSATKTMAVQDMSEIKFGVWRGTIEFSIEMVDTENYVPGNILE